MFMLCDQKHRVFGLFCFPFLNFIKKIFFFIKRIFYEKKNYLFNQNFVFIQLFTTLSFLWNGRRMIMKHRTLRTLYEQWKKN